MTEKDKNLLRLNNLPIVNDDGEIIEMPRFRTLNNISLFPVSKGVINDKPTMTIPGQAMSVSELLKRYNAGLSVPKSDMEYMENETPIPLIRDLTDIKEVEEYMNSLKERIQVAKEKVNEIKALEKIKKDKELDEKIKEQLKSLNNDNKNFKAEK